MQFVVVWKDSIDIWSHTRLRLYWEDIHYGTVDEEYTELWYNEHGLLKQCFVRGIVDGYGYTRLGDNYIQYHYGIFNAEQVEQLATQVNVKPLSTFNCFIDGRA